MNLRNPAPGPIAVWKIFVPEAYWFGKDTVSLFSIAVIRYTDQEQLRKGGICFAL